MVVRELVALLGVKTDSSSFKKADSLLTKAKRKVVEFAGSVFGLWAAFAGVRKIVNFASSANETLNVLDAAFEENQQTVLDWAKSFSDEAGRSEFAMREMAATLGAVLNPLMGKNALAASEMGTRFAELAVDLGSFFDTAEPDVLIALRSAISGEAEPMKRFGVILTEATLKAFALSQGINKNIKSMSIAEKTALRYNFILDQTEKAHGDAAKTSEGWANASKRLSGTIRDIATRFGLRFLPLLEKGIDSLGNWLKSNEGAIDSMGRFLEILFKLIVGAGKFLANLPLFAKIGLVILMFLTWSKAAAALGRVLLFLASPLGLFLILAALIILVVEDLITWVEGGDSVFGKLFETLDELTGLPISEYIKDIIKWFQKLSEDPVDAVADLIGAFHTFGKELLIFFDELWDDAIEGFISYFIGPIAKALKDTFGIVKNLFTGKTRDIHGGEDLRTSEQDKRVRKNVAKAAAASRALGAMRAEAGTGQKATAPAGAGGPAVYAPVNNTKIEVKATPDMDEKKLAVEIGKEADKVNARDRRNAMKRIIPAKAAASPG